MSDAIVEPALREACLATSQLLHAHLMACEPEGPQLRLKVPYHDMVIEGTRYELLHVGIEGHGCDGIFVASERTLQRGIFRLKQAHTG